MPERGKLLVVEGGVGCGKTTQLALLANRLLSDNWLFFREPGGTVFGEVVRNAVQGGGNEYPVHPYAELFAYMSARANLIREKVAPLIKDGKNVGLDRYWFATYAYQGARGISKPLIIALSLFTTGGLLPDLTFFYDLCPEVGMVRKKSSAYTAEIDRLDLEGIGFHRKVRKNYHQLGYLFPHAWETIDASGSIEEVYQLSVNKLRRRRLV